MQIGNIRNGTKSFSNPQAGRVYDIKDVSPTLNTAQGGGRIPYIIVEDNNERHDCFGQIDS